ncbi:MAG: 1-acyl-sn-glycerol-3-phosphate acyltransferase [Prevotellaceae bacterium]|nr:1-acyl-sn-glycerol-3-phosphate acyltransferase [Prevotellaceae bacterium]
MKQILFTVYFWLIAVPVLCAATVVTALLTIVLSPLFPDSKLSYFPARSWARFVCFVLFVRVKISGMEHIDPKQSYVFVLNHQSYFDIFIVYGWLPSIFKWIMKSELRKIPFVGLACQAAGHIFIDRSSPVAASKSVEKAKEQLQHGVSVVVFPEGTRTRDGKMQPFKRGAFRIAADLELPIVTATLIGSYERFPRTTSRFTPGKVELRIHKAIDVKPYLPDKISELIDFTWKEINSELVTV